MGDCKARYRRVTALLLFVVGCIPFAVHIAPMNKVSCSLHGRKIQNEEDNTRRLAAVLVLLNTVTYKDFFRRNPLITTNENVIMDAVRIFPVLSQMEIVNSVADGVIQILSAEGSDCDGLNRMIYEAYSHLITQKAVYKWVLIVDGGSYVNIEALVNHIQSKNLSQTSTLPIFRGSVSQTGNKVSLKSGWLMTWRYIEARIATGLGKCNESTSESIDSFEYGNAKRILTEDLFINDDLLSDHDQSGQTIDCLGKGIDVQSIITTRSKVVSDLWVSDYGSKKRVVFDRERRVFNFCS